MADLQCVSLDEVVVHFAVRPSCSGHWGIENGLHHVRDQTLGEDACRVRRGNTPQVLAAARNLALGLLRPLQFPSIAAATRRIVMHPTEGLQQITGGG